MISFKEFFLEFYDLKHNSNGRSGSDFRRRMNRDGGVSRGNNPRNGQLSSANLMPNRYKVGNHNYDQNKVQKTGVISNAEAEELISKHNIKRFPAKLGKRPFMLHKTPTGYSVQEIN